MKYLLCMMMVSCRLFASNVINLDTMSLVQQTPILKQFECPDGVHEAKSWLLHHIKIGFKKYDILWSILGPTFRDLALCKGLNPYDDMLYFGAIEAPEKFLYFKMFLEKMSYVCDESLDHPWWKVSFKYPIGNDDKKLHTACAYIFVYNFDKERNRYYVKEKKEIKSWPHWYFERCEWDSRIVKNLGTEVFVPEEKHWSNLLKRWNCMQHRLTNEKKRYVVSINPYDMKMVKNYPAAFNLNYFSPEIQKKIQQAITTPQVMVDALYQLAKDACEIFEVCGINWRTKAGTLLGMSRNIDPQTGRGGQIPYDDDVDFCGIYEKEKFEKAATLFGEKGYDFFSDKVGRDGKGGEDVVGWKIYYKNKFAVSEWGIDKEDMPIFADFFTYEWDPNFTFEVTERYRPLSERGKGSQFIKGAYRMTTERGKKFWPRSFIPKGEFEATELGYYGDMMLRTPPKEFIDQQLSRWYGNDWREKFYFKDTHIHRVGFDVYWYTEKEQEFTPALSTGLKK